MNHDLARLTGAGYVDTGARSSRMPALSALLKMARERNVAADAVRAFRIAPGDEWAILLAPGAAGPYRDEALAP